MKLLERKDYLNKLIKFKDKQLIKVITGIRRCGKSTLLKTLARLIKPISGDIVIDGKKVTSMPSKQLAKVLGLLPQSPVVPEGITVWD